jgi:hypothetical protein
VIEMAQPKPDFRKRLLQAQDLTTPQKKLAKLAKSPEWEVRHAVANNASTSLKTLTKLADDEIFDVRLAAKPQSAVRAAYDACESVGAREWEYLIELAGKEAREVYYDAASDSGSPEVLLVILARVSDPVVRHLVAQNPSTPLNAIRTLTQDFDATVRKSALANLSKKAPPHGHPAAWCAQQPLNKNFLPLPRLADRCTDAVDMTKDLSMPSELSQNPYVR